MYGPSVGVDHNDIPALAPIAQKIMGQLIRALIDLLVIELALRRPHALGFEHAKPVRVLIGIAREDLMEC